MVGDAMTDKASPGDTSTRTERIYLTITILVALLMFVAAAGSGSGDGGVPAWVDITANVVAAAIGVAVLILRTRAIGGLFAALSAGVNLTADGVDYFLRVLPYSVVSIGLGVAVFLH